MATAYDTLIQGLLGPTGAQAAKEEAFTKGLLGAIFQAAALSGPQARQVGTAQGLGQIGMTALGTYEQARQANVDEALKALQASQMLAKANQPDYKTLKGVDGVEYLVQIPRAGTPSLVNIPGLPVGGAGPKFDAPTLGYIQFKYGKGKTFGDLTTDQQTDVLRFSQAPNDKEYAEVMEKLKRGEYEIPGFKANLPTSRSQMLTPPAPTVAPSAATTPVAPVAPSATVSPVAPAETQVAPVSTDKTTIDKTSSLSGIKLPITLVSTPMKDTDVPLINSQGISGKAKEELRLAQPQQTGAVEAVVNTNRQMRAVIDELLANPGLADAFGLGGETLSKFPGSNAARVRALLDRLGGNLFVDAITAMRNASKTGAAVGNATEKEGDKLQASRAALSQAQKASDAIKELTSLKSMLEQQESIVVNAYNRTYGKGSFQFVPVTPSPSSRKPLDSIFGGQK